MPDSQQQTIQTPTNFGGGVIHIDLGQSSRRDRTPEIDVDVFCNKVLLKCRGNNADVVLPQVYEAL